MKRNLIYTLTVFLSVQTVIAGELISDEENQLPSLIPLRTRSISRGPGIKVISPDLDATTKSPVNIKVQFEARGGSKIDSSSVKVIYLKSPNIDITQRLNTGITESGIDFSKAEIPPGNQSLQVIVKDSDGRENTTVLNFTIIK